MRLARTPWLLGVGALAALLGSHLAGCGGNSSTANSSGQNGTGGSAATSSGTAGATSSSGTGTTTTGTGGSATGTGGSTTGTGGATSATSSTTSSTSTTSSSSSGPPPAGCGNGTLDSGEECDDGNNFDLDGCDANCKYEVVTRMTAIAISNNTGPAFCVHNKNQLGKGALTSTALSAAINPGLTTAINGGTVNVMTQFVGLSDDTGTAATGFSIGVLDGSPDPAKGTWPTTGTTNPIDWWFLADHTTVTSTGLPAGQLTGGAITAHALTAGPSNVTLAITLAGTPAVLQMNNTKIAGTIGTPTDAPAPPPTQLETGLTVFETVTANTATQGLCGDVTVTSLAAIPVPSALTSGTYACTEAYTPCTATTTVGVSCNSLLDVIVGGCTIQFIGVPVAAVNKTQPDVQVGSGTHTLTAGNMKIVSVPAGDQDAYSAYLTFTANRAHFTGETCAVTTDCQSGKTCTSGTCK